MIYYIIKRIMYALPILIIVNILTFVLFFMVNSPDDIANIHLGGKHVNQEEVDNWKKNHGYDKPLFYNKKYNKIESFTKTIFFQKSMKLFVFDFGISDNG